MSKGTDLSGCLEALDQHLSECSYIGGHTPSQADSVVHGRLAGAVPPHNGPALPSHLHLARWYKHIASFGSQVQHFPPADLSILSQFNLPSARLLQVIQSHSVPC